MKTMWGGGGGGKKVPDSLGGDVTFARLIYSNGKNRRSNGREQVYRGSKRFVGVGVETRRGERRKSQERNGSEEPRGCQSRFG